MVCFLLDLFHRNSNDDAWSEMIPDNSIRSVSIMNNYIKLVGVIGF